MTSTSSHFIVLIERCRTVHTALRLLWIVLLAGALAWTQAAQAEGSTSKISADLQAAMTARQAPLC